MPDWSLALTLSNGLALLGWIVLILAPRHSTRSRAWRSRAAARMDRAGLHRIMQAVVLLLVLAAGPAGFLLCLLALAIARRLNRDRTAPALS